MVIFFFVSDNVLGARVRWGGHEIVGLEITRQCLLEMTGKGNGGEVEWSRSDRVEDWLEIVRLTACWLVGVIVTVIVEGEDRSGVEKAPRPIVLNFHWHLDLDTLASASDVGRHHMVAQPCQLFFTTTFTPFPLSSCLSLSFHHLNLPPRPDLPAVPLLVYSS